MNQSDAVLAEPPGDTAAPRGIDGPPGRAAHPAPIKYRAEIDGLRAVAVVLVILFHAGIPGFSYGYLGVDVFFAISGFLITSIIFSQVHTNTFSYGVFIERRVRRILPTLLVVMLACIPLAYLLMLPDPLENFGQSLIATTLSANNILLWITTGYWDLAAEFKPLLHTWSLGVEEQFYIAYPFVLIFCLRYAIRHCLLVMLALAALSLTVMVLHQEADPAGTFYLLHYRAWQLLLGGIGALLIHQYHVARRPVLASLGIGLIGLAALGGPFLSLSAPLAMLVATLGAMLFLVFADGTGPASRVLSSRAFVGVGLMSYSVYLWHQPVFAFLRISRFEHTGPIQFLAVIPLIFLLSFATWAWVEKPFRDAKRIPRKALAATVGLSMLLTAGIGLAFYLGEGLPTRMAGVDESTAAGSTISYNERIRERLGGDWADAPGDRGAILITGNSFARDFANVLIEAGAERRFSLHYRERLPGCSKDWTTEDQRFLASLDIVVFASGTYDLQCAPATIRALRAAGVTAVFVGPKHFGDNLNPLVRLDALARAKQRLVVPPEIIARNDRQASALGNAYVNMLGVLSPDNRTVQVADQDGLLLTTDQIHLSRAGAQFLARRLSRMSPMLAGILADPVPERAGET